MRRCKRTWPEALDLVCFSFAPVTFFPFATTSPNSRINSQRNCVINTIDCDQILHITTSFCNTFNTSNIQLFFIVFYHLLHQNIYLSLCFYSSIWSILDWKCVFNLYNLILFTGRILQLAVYNCTHTDSKHRRWEVRFPTIMEGSTCLMLRSWSNSCTPQLLYHDVVCCVYMYVRCFWLKVSGTWRL